MTAVDQVRVKTMHMTYIHIYIYIIHVQYVRRTCSTCHVRPSI